MPRVQSALLVLALAGTLRAEPRSADRVVARVDGKPILLSELRREARPRVAQRVAWERPRALRRALGAAREEAIASALLAEHARRLGLVVSDAEVEAALTRVAADAGLDVDGLFAEALAHGYPPRAYRAELRRQLLEQRVLASEPFGAAGPPPDDPAAYARWWARRRGLLLGELGRRACIERFGRF